VKVLEAMDLAIRAHKGQVRKYSGRPYILHPFRVAMMVTPYVSTDGVIAALLHDAVEMGGTTLREIRDRFGSRVAYVVDTLTDLDLTPRARKKEMTISRIGGADYAVQTIKAADMLDNCRSIAVRDQKFWEGVYRDECRALYEVLDMAASHIMIPLQEVLWDESTRSSEPSSAHRA
jgi:(p)ppGpp synthase/HD superfamily hydrolase